MRQKLILAISITGCCFLGNSYAQRTGWRSRSFSHDAKKLGVFISPFSFFEPRGSGIGAGLSYNLSVRWQITSEFNYLCDWLPGIIDYRSKGFRNILTAKRFSLKHRMFYGVDARLKVITFNDIQDFINLSADDSLTRYEHRARHTLLCIGPVFGLLPPVPKNKKFEIQISVGFGVKYRIIHRENIPEGYEFHEKFYMPVEPALNFFDSPKSGFTFYVPAALRFFWYFNKLSHNN